MICDKCGYTMDAFDKECPRCQAKATDKDDLVTPQWAQSAMPIAWYQTQRGKLLAAIAGVSLFVICLVGFTVIRPKARESITEPVNVVPAPVIEALPEQPVAPPPVSPPPVASAPVPVAPKTVTKTQTKAEATKTQAPVVAATPVPQSTAVPSDYVPPATYVKSKQQRQDEFVERLRKGEDMQQIMEKDRAEGARLMAESERLKDATTKAEVQERIRINQELVFRMKTSQSQTEKTRRKIAQLESEIQTDMLRLSSMK